MSGPSVFHKLESKRARQSSLRPSYLLLVLLFVAVVSVLLSGLAWHADSPAMVNHISQAAHRTSTVTVNGQTIKLSDPVNYSRNFTSRGSNVSVSVYSHDSSSGNSAVSTQSSVVVNTN